MTEKRCPWQWRHLHCALPPRHPSPHHIVGEQPDFDRIEKTIAQEERERLGVAFDVYWEWLVTQPAYGNGGGWGEAAMLKVSSLLASDD